MIDYNNNSATRISTSLSHYVGIFFFPYAAISLFCLSKLCKNKCEKINKNIGVMNGFANIVAVNTIVFGFVTSYLLKEKYGDNIIPGLANGFNTPLSAGFGIFGIMFTAFAVIALPTVMYFRHKFDVKNNNECTDNQNIENKQENFSENVKRDLIWFTITGLFLNTIVYSIERVIKKGVESFNSTRKEEKGCSFDDGDKADLKNSSKVKNPIIDELGKTKLSRN